MMEGYAYFLFVYAIGGLTFIPLVLVAIFVHAYFSFPIVKDYPSVPSTDAILRPGDRTDIKAASKGLEEKFQSRGALDTDVAAGYFAVCREYTPGGINGKPPERLTPTGATAVTSPSPSVYQSMYRSIFDRKKEPSPFDNKGAPKPPNKGGNVFYIVLRHQHLLLFDTDEQIEVRYVIPLAHHDVSLYAGGESMPEGELFIKRNAIMLTRRKDAGEMTADGQTSKPFFLFADNLSEKEDFYFALLKNIERRSDEPQSSPVPLQFDVKHIIDLVQRLHSSEEHMQIRWFNAMLGRIFLGIYKTPDFENFIRAKITKKISRVKKPAFLSKIVIRKVDLGQGAPYLMNPRLKDLTVDGDCTIEADMQYTGNARLEIAATARIELGSRFKAREVDLVLAVTCKRIEGHMLFRVKPPPSNRLWMTFEHPPRIDLSIEPIVSSRQITYGVILRQIESRIKEVIAESVVMPFWDDLAFFNTEGKTWRAGVFVDKATPPSPFTAEDDIATHGDVYAVEQHEAELASVGPQSATSPSVHSSFSTPNSEIPSNSTPSATTGTFARKAARGVFNMGSSKANASTTSFETKSAASVLASETPRNMRRSSNATPVVGVDNTTISGTKPNSPQKEPASANLTAVSAKSATAMSSPPGSLEKKPGFPGHITGSYSSSSSSETPPPDYLLDDDRKDSEYNIANDEEPNNNVPPSPSGFGSDGSSMKFPRFGETHSTFASTTSFNRSATDGTTSSGASASKKKTALNAVTSAAEQARKWGLSAIQRTREKSEMQREERDLTQPMGRGTPLPPPGTPLPYPEGKGPSKPVSVPKRKPLPPPDLSKEKEREQEVRSRERGSSVRHSVPPPPLPRRRPQSGQAEEYGDNEGIFVVPAPGPDSEPASPSVEAKKEYMAPSMEEEQDVDLLTKPEAAKKAPPQLPRRRMGTNSSFEQEDIPVVRA